MRYFLYILSFYLIIWTFFDIDITDINEITKFLPSGIITTSNIIGLAYIAILVIILEELYSKHKLVTRYKKITFLMPFVLGVASVFISFPKLTNNLISHFEIFVLMLGLVIFSRILVMILEGVFLLNQIFRQRRFDLFIIELLSLGFFAFIFIQLPVRIIDYILPIKYLATTSVVYYLFIFTKAIFDIRNYDFSFGSKKLLKIYDTKLLDLFSPILLKITGNKQYQKIYGLLEEIIEEYDDDDDKTLIIQIPKSITIIQTSKGGIFLKGIKNQRVPILYGNKKTEVTIKDFNECIVNVRIKKGFLEILGDNKNEFFASFLTKEFLEIIKKYKVKPNRAHNSLKIEDLNHKNMYDILLDSVLQGDLEFLKKIITKFPDIDIDRYNDKSGFNPLIMASAENQLSIVKYLLEIGADVNIRNLGRGASALSFAVRYGFVEIVKILIEYGADVNILDDKGVSPLIMASSYGYNDIVNLLLLNGANTKLKCHGKRNAYDYAKKGKYGKIMKMILNHEKINDS